MNHVRISIALAWAPKCFDRSICQAERDERIREVLALLGDLGNED